MQQSNIAPTVIALTGPESTGKTTLAKQLAFHFKGGYLSEFARSYLLEKNGLYTANDVLHIAKTQYQSMNFLINQNKKQNQPFIFVDTELLVTKIWYEHTYGYCHPWIKKHVPLQKIDLYLLTSTEIPWVYDPLREMPDKLQRRALYEEYRQSLTAMKVDFMEIKGSNYEKRFNQAVTAIQKVNDKKSNYFREVVQN